MNLTPLSSEAICIRDVSQGWTGPWSVLSALSARWASTAPPTGARSCPHPASTIQPDPAQAHNAVKAIRHFLELKGRERCFPGCDQPNPKRMRFSPVQMLPWFYSLPSAGMKSRGCRQKPLFKAGQATEGAAWASKTLEKKWTQQAWDWHASQSWNKTGKKSHASLKQNRWKGVMILRILFTGLEKNLSTSQGRYTVHKSCSQVVLTDSWYYSFLSQSPISTFKRTGLPSGCSGQHSLMLSVSGARARTAYSHSPESG